MKPITHIAFLLALLCALLEVAFPAISAPMPTMGLVPKPLPTNPPPVVVTNRVFCLTHGLPLKVTKIRSDTLKQGLGGAMRFTVQDVHCPKRLCPVGYTETNQTWITEAELPAFLKKNKIK